MKKILSFIVFLFVFILSTSCAKESKINVEKDLFLLSYEAVYEKDGSYTLSNLYASSIDPIGDIYNTYVEKDVIRYSSTNAVLWQYTLSGYFTVNKGISCECYDASYKYNINDSNWIVSNCSTTYYDNVANGKGTFKQNFLFLTTKIMEIDLYLSCDKYGNFS